MTTNSYSGYLKVSETKSLHYIFVESENNATTDPVVIWFNGGPGCSSLLGFFQENGPWVIEDSATEVIQNPFPWNMNASVMYLESPAGVGYSIANTTEDLSQNDMTQSKDAFIALQAWYEKFPEFAENDLYISGESYGGIYVPYLTWQVFQHNRNVEIFGSGDLIPIAGMIVGNGATDWTYDATPVFPDTVGGFSVIPQSLWQSATENGCFEYFRDVRPAPNQEICEPILSEIGEITANLFVYDLMRPIPAGGIMKASEGRLGTTMINGEERTFKRGYTMSEYTPWLKGHPMFSKGQDEILLGDYLSEYLNTDEMRSTLNIPDYAPTWEMCSSTLDYHLQQEGSIWIYQVLQASGIRMMFYSGDTDAAVATEGTRRWISDLDWDILEPWRYWTTNKQVSGYIQKYDGLDFITVKGVGHMAPQWSRQAVTQMITRWIHGEEV